MKKLFQSFGENEMEIIEKFIRDRKHLIETYPEWKEVYIDKV